MKHDALTQAISMLDDEFLIEARRPFEKRRYASVIGFCSAAAVCAAAVGAVLFLPRSGGAEILIMGQNPSEKAITLRTESQSDAPQVSAIRAFSFDCTEIPVSVVSSKPAVITVSGGELLLCDGEERQAVSSPYETEGDASLVWNVPLWDGSAQFELSAQTGKECRILLLSFDESLQEWTITETPES